MPDRDYTFLELTNALCSKCLRKVEAKVIEREGKVYLDKWCPEHGPELVLISSDADYYRFCRTVEKASEMPLKFNTPIKYGCPYDCGICPGHEQHSCLALVEITNACNLRCPICYSSSSPDSGPHKTMPEVIAMLDAIVENEGSPAVVQISGGEPTIHPDFFEILDEARKRPIKHLMINTNGVRIAEDEEFAQRLATYMPGFEVYLQFDSLGADALKDMRGLDLSDVRRKALEKLNRLGISTTLVVVVKKGVNDHEIGEILRFALQQPCVRGVTFQPVQVEGRTRNYDPAINRLTLADVRRLIVEQQDVLEAKDVIPVPCHPDNIAMAYALKLEGQVIPLTRFVDLTTLAKTGGATIAYEKSDLLKAYFNKLFSAATSPAGSASDIQQLLCCLPQIPSVEGLGYQNLFRIIIMKFMDRYDMDVRSVKKACVHMVHDDGRIIPFDTYNLFYRKGVEANLEAAKRASGVVSV